LQLAQKACVMNENELISLADFRRRLRDRTGIEFHHSTVRRWHRAGRIPQGTRIGARWYVPANAVDDLIAPAA